MEKRKLLTEVKKCYEDGGNVIQYLKEINNRTENTIEDILISYDFQAGTYYEKYKERTKKQELV